MKDLNGKEIVVTNYEKEFQKKNKTKFRMEKVIKKKLIHCRSSEKVMKCCLIAG